MNLPRLAASAGLGTLSPFGLLVHPVFGWRLVLAALRSGYPLDVAPRWAECGCTDWLQCVRERPQDPAQAGVVELGYARAARAAWWSARRGVRDVERHGGNEHEDSSV